MPRRENRTTPKIMSATLYTDDAFTGTAIGGPAWFTWLDAASTFYFESPAGTFTAHCERRHRGGCYWIAYPRRAGFLHRLHLGKANQLTLARLEATALTLSTSVLYPA